MSAGLIRFDSVWKKFRRGERHDSLRDLIPWLARRLVGLAPGQADLEDQEFWAVRDVSFEVKPGQALGIIGPNGAGKSTILKLLTRILKPTRGRCEVRGRSGALIEVAAGFHPDLTGRENVFLQGAIMGMRRDDIARQFDAITAFAGLGEFIDTPVKRYSSGMNARLGFAIAAHLEPEVLLIDEVLAVGDMAFQERCYEKMREFRRQGVAIAFVSHNLAAVSMLCDSVLVLRRGETAALSEPGPAIAKYAALLQSGSGGGPASGNAPEAAVELLSDDGRTISSANAGDPLTLRAVITLPKAHPPIFCTIRFRRLDTGEPIYYTTSTTVGCAALPGGASAFENRWRIRANFARGHYSVELTYYTEGREDLILRLNPAAQFEIRETETAWGVVHLEAHCTLGAREPAARSGSTA